MNKTTVFELHMGSNSFSKDDIGKTVWLTRPQWYVRLLDRIGRGFPFLDNICRRLIARFYGCGYFKIVDVIDNMTLKIERENKW